MQVMHSHSRTKPSSWPCPPLAEWCHKSGTGCHTAPPARPALWPARHKSESLHWFPRRSRFPSTPQGRRTPAGTGTRHRPSSWLSCNHGDGHTLWWWCRPEAGRKWWDQGGSCHKAGKIIARQCVLSSGQRRRPENTGCEKDEFISY